VRDPAENFFAAACTEPFVITFPGLGPVYFTATVDGTREILSAPREGSSAPAPNPIEPIVGPNSVILTSGEHHSRTRQLLQPPFRGSQTDTRANCVAQSVIEETRSWQPGDRIRLHTVSQSITLRIIIRVVLGDTSDALYDHCMNVVAALMNANTAPLMLMPQLRKDFMGRGPWARLLRLRAEFDELIDSFVEERRADPGIAGDDVLSHLLAEADGSGTPLDYDDLRQQLRSLIAAGHDTTAAALAWALYYVHRVPGVRERVMAGLAGASGNPTPQEMANLPYLSAVVSETLRMHPAVPIVLRRLEEPRTIASVERKPGDVIGIAVPALHFNPRLWPDPDEFRPERFLEHHPPQFGYLPFGGGYRRCIGHPSRPSSWQSRSAR
jgi:cytochrome P450